jgi:nucleotide-binding universal stress UspA family protein
VLCTAGGMESFRHLLVATDFSESAFAALRAAAGLAKSLEAELSLVHVVQPYRPLAVAKASLRDADVEGPMVQEASEHLNEVAASLQGLRARTHVVADPSPSHAIASLADNLNADLIITGTRGAGGFTRLLLGSVAEQVVRHAPCSVLTVGRRAFSEAPLANGILVGTDLCDGSEAALDAAAMLSRVFATFVTVAYVFDPDRPHPDPRNIGEAFGDPDTVERELTKRLEALVRQRFAERARGEMLYGSDAAFTLCEHAERTHPEILVVATHGRKGLSRAMLGSVAERVVRHSPAPVLIVRRR